MPPRKAGGIVGTDVEALKREACAAVDRLRDELLRVSRAIHAVPELAFEEREAASLLVDTLLQLDRHLPVVL